MQKSFFLKNREGEGREERGMRGGCKQEKRKRVKIDSGFVLLLSDMFCIWVSSKGMCLAVLVGM